MSVPITDLLGERALITKVGPYMSKAVEEVRVLEISPSNNYVRVMSQFGTKTWLRVVDIALVEKLITIEPRPR